MSQTPWWDIAAIAGIGVVCALLLIRRLRQAFGVSSGGGCPGCSKGCGAESGDKTDKSCSS